MVGSVGSNKVGSRNRVAARSSTIRKAVVTAVVAAMALVLAKASADKTRLSSKGRYRPHWIMRKKMPDGTGQLSELPVRARLAERVGEEAADDEYCKAIATATKIFGKKMRGQSTPPTSTSCTSA